MSSAEIDLGALTLPPLQDDLEDYFDETDERVRHTADDRPNTATLPAMNDPAADHLDAEVAARRADVEEKHQRVVAFLDEHNLDALILGRADSIAWFTAGGDLAQSLSSERGAVLLFINRRSRAVISDNVQSARAFEEELSGLGFQLKERPGTTTRNGSSPSWATERRSPPISP